MPKVIDSNPNLKSFAINDNFYDQAAYDLCKSFIEAKNLRLLDLSDCMAAENFANQILNGIALSKSPIEVFLTFFFQYYLTLRPSLSIQTNTQNSYSNLTVEFF